MDDHVSTAHVVSVIGGIMATISGVLTWVFKRQITKIDDTSRRVDALERATVTKDDLAAATLRLENTINEGIKELHKDLSAAHKRIDDLYREMPRR